MDRKKIGLILIFVAFGGITWALTRKKTNTDGQNAGNSVEETEFSKKVNEAVKNGTGEVMLTLNEIAEQLHAEMRKVNTDKRVIFALLSPIKPLDFNEIIKIFGSRPYSSVSKTDISDGIVRDFQPADLKFWLKSELPPTDYHKLKKQFPNQL